MLQGLFFGYVTIQLVCISMFLAYIVIRGPNNTSLDPLDAILLCILWPLIPVVIVINTIRYFHKD
jgi:hypothetical protein